MTGSRSPLKRSRTEYLDHAAATEPGRDYKQKILAALDLLPGHTVLDIGCGPGTDLARIADQVGSGGTVLGIDADPAMVAEAQRRMNGRATIQVREGDAHALPVPDRSVDRVRMDRVAQHLADPAGAFTEAWRVLRLGGLLAVADPDWDTLVIADPDAETSRAYTRFVATQVVRNGAIGRHLSRLAAEAGFDVCSVAAIPVLFTDFHAGNAILRLPIVMERAVTAGAVEAPAARRWLDRITAGPFLAAFTFFMVVAQRPALTA